MGIFTGDLLREFSTPLLLPFSCTTYANVLISELNNFNKKFKTKFSAIDIHLDELEDSIKNFSIVADKFTSRVKSEDRTQ